MKNLCNPFFNLFVLLCLGISFTVFLSCSKKENQASLNTNVTNVESNEPDLNLITLKKGDKVVLDNPSKFVQLWILISYDQKKWLDEINNNTNSSTNEDPEILLTKRREEFYRSYGITENDFTKYSENHFDEINSFLEKNPKYKKAIEDSTK